MNGWMKKDDCHNGNIDVRTQEEEAEGGYLLR